MIGIQTESEFDRIIRDAEFSYQLMEQNREMERFVNESIILASGNRSAINEMAIINEAAAGDKIKSFFEKIKNFFKKIFDKLGASMSALFKEQKDYIDKYAQIITKCKWNVGDVTDIYDHFKGLPRIISVVDAGEPAILGSNMDKYFKGETPPEDKNLFIDTNTFATKESITQKLEEIKKDPVDPNKERTKAFNEFISSGYWAGLDGFAAMKQNDANGNANAADTFKAWFNGSADTITYSGDEMENNFQTCINVCYAGQSYLNKLEKIVTTVNKKMDDAARAMENYHKAQKEKILEYANKESGNVEEVTITITKNGETYKANVPDAKYLKADKTGEANQEKTGTLENVKTQINECIDPAKAKVKFVEPSEEAKPSQNTNSNEISFKINDDTNKQETDAGKYTVTYTPSKPTGAPDASTANETKDAFKARVTKAITDASKTPKEVTESTFNLYRDYKNYFNEVNFGSGSSSGTDTKGPTGAGATQVKNAGETNTKLSNATTNAMNAKDNITVAGGTAKEAEELLSLDIKNREAKINADIMVSTAIATAAFNAFKLTNSDFFGAIKAHVQWYLNNPGAEKASENQTTRTKSLDMNAAGTPVSSKAKPAEGETKSETT
jgi:transcription initiation factor TFIIIB Brf1 subunit/transcription initiation factor TFIIB